MREAQDLRAGNTVKIGNDLFLVTKFTYNKGARNASMVKMKLKNLSTGNIAESVCKAADKFEDVVLERRTMQFLYASGDFYTFMDQENFEQMDLTKEDLGDALNYLKEQMSIDVVLYGARAVGVEMPINVELKVTYSEPATRATPRAARCSRRRRRRPATSFRCRCTSTWATLSASTPATENSSRELEPIASRNIV